MPRNATHAIKLRAKTWRDGTGAWNNMAEGQMVYLRLHHLNEEAVVHISYDDCLEVAVNAVAFLGDTAEEVRTDRKAAFRVLMIGLSLSMQAKCQCIVLESTCSLHR